MAQTKRKNKRNMSNKTKKLTKKTKQTGSGLFSSSSKEKKQKFTQSMKHFCEVTDNGNNVKKSNKVLRESVHKVCSDFYEAEQSTGGGIIKGTFQFVGNLIKKPLVFVSSKVSSMVSTPESNTSIPPLRK